MTKFFNILLNQIVTSSLSIVQLLRDKIIDDCKNNLINDNNSNMAYAIIFGTNHLKIKHTIFNE